VGLHIVVIDTFNYYLDGYSLELISLAVQSSPIWLPSNHFIETHVFLLYALTIVDSIITCRIKVIQFLVLFHIVQSDLDFE